MLKIGLFPFGDGCAMISLIQEKVLTFESFFIQTEIRSTALKVDAVDLFI